MQAYFYGIPVLGFENIKRNTNINKKNKERQKWQKQGLVDMVRLI